MALGHEAAGVVEEIGAGVRDVRAGDHVVLTFVPSCGLCAECSSGRPALCVPGAQANGAGTLLHGPSLLRDRDGKPIHHHLGISGFARHAVVARESAVVIARDVPLGTAALFGCAVLTGAGAVLNTASVRAGQSVAVFGLGGVGLAAVLGAVAAGAHPIVGVDVLPAKLEQARALGATHVVLASDERAVEAIREATGGGARHVIETAGHERALAQAYAATRRGGTTVVVGLPDPRVLLAVAAVGIVAEERTIQGSYLGSAVPARDVPRYVALYRAGRLPVDRLLSHRLRLDQLDEGFDRLARGEAVRQVVLLG
jgi:alcohol dehydrogenase